MGLKIDVNYTILWLDQSTAYPDYFIQLPGRVIHHARYVYIRIEGHCRELLQLIRTKITKVRSGMGAYAVNTS